MTGSANDGLALLVNGMKGLTLALRSSDSAYHHSFKIAYPRNTWHPEKINLASN